MKVAVTLQLRLEDGWRTRLAATDPAALDPAVHAVDLVASAVMRYTFDGPWDLEAIAAVRQP